MPGETVMRIAHLITNLALAGAEMMLYKLLSRMDRQAFDPMVVSLTEYGPLAACIAKLGIPVFAMGMGSGLSLPTAFGRLIRTVRRFNPDLIQGWQYHGNLAAQFVRPFLVQRVPVLWNIRHSLDTLAHERRATAAIIKLGAKWSYKPAYVVYVARASAAQHEKLGYQASKRVVIPNGFDIEQFCPSPQARIQVRERLGLPSSAILIGMIARYHPMKDHANFLNAAADLLRFHPEVHFLLAGGGVDQKNSGLMDMIRRLNLNSRVHLLGARHDIPQVAAALDIGSSTASWGEGFSNAIGEAMACAVPCVVTDVGDSALIVGDTGKVIPARDPHALSEAWRTLIDLGPEGRGALGLNARLRIQQHFSLPTIVARYEQLYRGVYDKFSPKANTTIRPRT